MCALDGFFYVRHLKETKTPLCLSASRRLLSLLCALRRKIAGSHLFLFLFLISLRFLLTLKIRILLFPFWNAHVSNLNKEQDSTYSKTLPFFALTEDYREACAVLLSNRSRTLLQPLTSPKKRKVSREIHKRSRLPHLGHFPMLFLDPARLRRLSPLTAVMRQ